MSTSQDTPQFGLGKSIAFSAILIFLVLGVSECSVRSWAYFYREKSARYDTASGTFALMPGKHRTPLGVVEINSRGFTGRELQPDGPDLWRIVALGDSCTFGAGDLDHTYPAMLEQRLKPLEQPGVRYEVVNAGISGNDSEHALRRLRSVVPALKPDVVLVYVGWNDLMKYDPLAQGDNGAWSGVARALDDLWIAKGLRKVLFYYVRPTLRPPATGPSSHSGRYAEFEPTVYERNLREILANVRSLGAKPLLVTLPTVVREDMTVDDVRRSGVVFPYFGSADSVGDLLDLLGAYNRAVQRVGREEGVPVVDLAALFAERSDVSAYFYDTMHTNDQGMAIIADAIAAALEQEGLLAPAPRAATAAER